MKILFRSCANPETTDFFDFECASIGEVSALIFDVSSKFIDQFGPKTISFRVKDHHIHMIY